MGNQKIIDFFLQNVGYIFCVYYALVFFVMHVTAESVSRFCVLRITHDDVTSFSWAKVFCRWTSASSTNLAMTLCQFYLGDYAEKCRRCE